MCCRCLRVPECSWPGPFFPWALRTARAGANTRSSPPLPPSVPRTPGPTYADRPCAKPSRSCTTTCQRTATATRASSSARHSVRGLEARRAQSPSRGHAYPPSPGGSCVAEGDRRRPARPLGLEIEEIFETFDATPVASGTIAQVTRQPVSRALPSRFSRAAFSALSAPELRSSSPRDDLRKLGLRGRRGLATGPLLPRCTAPIGHGRALYTPRRAESGAPSHGRVRPARAQAAG